MSHILVIGLKDNISREQLAKLTATIKEGGMGNVLIVGGVSALAVVEGEIPDVGYRGTSVPNTVEADAYTQGLIDAKVSATGEYHTGYEEGYSKGVSDTAAEYLRDRVPPYHVDPNITKPRQRTGTRHWWWS
jgi:hypothetical protein